MKKEMSFGLFLALLSRVRVGEWKLGANGAIISVDENGQRWSPITAVAVLFLNKGFDFGYWPAAAESMGFPIPGSTGALEIAHAEDNRQRDGEEGHNPVIRHHLLAACGLAA